MLRAHRAPEFASKERPPASARPMLRRSRRRGCTVFREQGSWELQYWYSSRGLGAPRENEGVSFKGLDGLASSRLKVGTWMIMGLGNYIAGCSNPVPLTGLV